MSKPKSRALGQGLDALLPTGPSPAPVTAPVPDAERSVFLCPIEQISPQEGQPRQHFDEKHLHELAESIAEHGLIEPIVVRRVSGGAVDRYEIIAGERRWRASMIAGLSEMAVVVKDVSPQKAFELAIIENIQRADLNPIELAEAFDRLIREHSYTHDTLAGLVKKDRSTVTNSLRLLKLPDRVRAMVMSGKLTEGHARALVAVEDENLIEQLAAKVVKEELNVRQTERLARELRKTRDQNELEAEAATPAPPPRSLSVKDLEETLARRFGTRVKVRDKKGKGSVVFAYGSLDELDRLLELMQG
jgi:ParB family chromosome partitioning protein